MKGIFKRRGKKLTAVATAFALLCSGGVLPEHIWQVSAETSEAGEEALAVNEENFPDEGLRKQVKLAPGMPEADLKVPYTIRAVGEVSLDAKWKWASGDSEKALPVGEKVTVTAEYIGDDADLYENIKQEVTIIRQVCEHPEEKLVLQGEKDNSCVDGYSGDYFCTQCNEIVERGEIRPARHNLTLVEAQPATDTVPGNIAYYVCNDCGKYFEDSDGTQETTPEKVTIPASGTSTPGLTPTPTLGATESPAATQSPSQTPGTAEPTGEPEKTVAPTNVPAGV